MRVHTIQPVNSLRIFAGKLIDYAGLFPPASLSLSQAFGNYLYYRQCEFNWMLNKLIIPAKKLQDLGKLIDEAIINTPLPISVIGSGGNSADVFNKSTAGDIKIIDSFLARNGDSVSIDAFEIKLPADVTEQEEADDMLDLMINVSGQMDSALGKDVPVFFEAALGEKYESTILKVAENIASLNNRCGFKLRTGGIEPAAFPETVQIANAIVTCAEFGIPVKCTAGLHHPIRHFSDSVNTYMHGFFNVFGAGILAYTNDLDETDLVEVLNDEDPEEFIFSDNGFEWNEVEVTNDEIKLARNDFIISYGSCSFDEPIEDLKIMELV